MASIKQSGVNGVAAWEDASRRTDASKTLCEESKAPHARKRNLCHSQHMSPIKQPHRTPSVSNPALKAKGPECSVQCVCESEWVKYGRPITFHGAHQGIAHSYPGAPDSLSVSLQQTNSVSYKQEQTAAAVLQAKVTPEWGSYHVSSSEASEESQLNKTLVCVIKSDCKLSQRVFRVLCCRFHGDLRSHYSANKNLQAKHQAQAFAGCWLTRKCRLVIFDCFSSFVGKSSSPVACRAVAVYRRRVTLSGWYGMGKGLRLNWQRKRGNCQGTTVVWLGPVLAQGDLILWSAQG